MTSYTPFAVQQIMDRHSLLYSQYDRTMEIGIVPMNLEIVHFRMLHYWQSPVYLPHLSISIKSQNLNHRLTCESLYRWRQIN